MSDNIDISNRIEKNIENNIRHKIENEIQTSAIQTKLRSDKIMTVETTESKNSTIESLKLPGNNERIVVKILETPFKDNIKDDTNKENRNYHVKCEVDGKTHLIELKNNILKKMMEELKFHKINTDASLKNENLISLIDKTFEIKGKLWISAPKKYRINGDLPTIFSVKLMESVKE